MTESGWEIAMRNIDGELDLPQFEASPLVRKIAANGFRLPATERTEFQRLPDEVIARMEDIVREAYLEAGEDVGCGCSGIKLLREVGTTVKVCSPVGVRPEVELVRWRIMRTDRGTLHLIGCNRLGGTGRVSTAVKELDAGEGHAVTVSGRRYTLSGPSDLHPAADYTWLRWCQNNHVEAFEDVTSEYES